MLNDGLERNSSFEIQKLLILNSIHVPLEVYNEYTAEKGVGAWEEVDEYSLKIAVPSLKQMGTIPFFVTMPDVLKNLINLARKNKCTHLQLVDDDLVLPSKLLDTFARPAEDK